MEHADLIESALTSGEAFVLPPTRETPAAQRSAAAVPEEPVHVPVDAASSEGSSAAPADNDAWKQEYEAQVQAWREQSAEARDKAEKERARWEAIRVEEAAQRKAAGIVDTPTEIPTGIPNIHSHPTASSASPDLVTSTAVDTEPESRGETTDGGSQKWVDVQASTSSFPSSFPERTEPSSPTRQVTSSSKPAPPSSTLAIFDSSLSTKTRVIALFSALAINLALPFVNGVMLGFGEIFAKNVVLQYFGWKPTGPGSVAAAAGLRSTRSRPSPFRTE
ncbi:hypothetical protein DFP72DRAFT_846130 [Ephemerocybe angulata]|uniref:Uncharacterized protein n=1 Tax=Ephemerocybe angulata TaxID=980116 RepID=A0A8H6I3I2_9AGAR|nr:hypothetical protein DFP72DRAFT_846130 [Tulosesus angulatus]